MSSGPENVGLLIVKSQYLEVIERNGQMGKVAGNTNGHPCPGGKVHLPVMDGENIQKGTFTQGKNISSSKKHWLSIGRKAIEIAELFKNGKVIYQEDANAGAGSPPGEDGVHGGSGIQG